MPSKPFFDCVLITEDNSQISSFKSPLGQRLGNWYLSAYIHKINKTCFKLSKQNRSVLLIANSEILSQITKSEKIYPLPFDKLIENSDFRRAGRQASDFSDLWQTIDTFDHSESKFELNMQTLGQTAFVQLSFLFFFYSALYFEMWKNFVNSYDFDRAYFLSNVSDLEEIAIHYFKKHNKKIVVKTPALLQVFRKFVFDLLYLRDRLQRINRLRPQINTSADAAVRGKIRTDVLLVVCHSLQLKTAIPLSKLLFHHGISNHLIISAASQSDSDLLNSNQIRWSLAKDYLDANSFNESRSLFKKRVASYWNRASSKTVTINDFIKEGLDFFKINKSKLSIFIRTSLVEAGLYLEIAERAIKKHEPKVVTVFSDARFLESGIAILGRKKGIKTFLLSPNPVMSADAINRYDTCEFVGVVGSYIYNRLIKKGDLKADQIRIVGDIRFDDLEKEKRRLIHGKVHADLGINKALGLVTLTSFYTTTWHPIDEKILFIRNVYNAIVKIPNLKLVIKAHPNEDEMLLKSLLSNEGIDQAVIVKNCSLYQLLLNSQFVVSLASSMTPIEAMLLDIPVVSFALSSKNTDHLFGYIKGKGALGIDERTDLYQLFDRLVNDETYRHECILNGRKFVSNYIAQPIGKAGNNILNLYKELLSLV